jgi:ketosteroid isomerase-like protein
MTEHPNATKLKQVIAAFQAGDLETLIDAYAEDAIYRVAGDNAISGSYQGRDAIRDFFIRLGEVTGGTMRLELHDTLADDHHAVMFWRVTAERGDASIDANGAMAFRIDDDGKYSESWFLYSDQRAYDAFYA